MGLRCLAFLGLLGGPSAQTVGSEKHEEPPHMAFSTCTQLEGCTSHDTILTMDAQWRWLHDAGYANCVQASGWIMDETRCGVDCAMEGISKSDYEGTYGVTEVDGGVKLQYVNGPSIGSRLYLMDPESLEPRYRMFKLLNRELSFDVDASTLACGINGALYFVEMDANGGLGKGDNKAGAKYGTGYCDAQCPHDLKFIDGKCNVKGWHETRKGPMGSFGSCCSEFDVWEANALSTAMTAHPCETLGPLLCEPTRENNYCGDTPDDCDCCMSQDPATCPCCGRYDGVCDKDGCDFNPYRLGNTTFYGTGPEHSVNTQKPMTVVTQFITDDGTDDGNLVEVRRLFVQDGKVLQNAMTRSLGAKADSLTDAYCSAQKLTFGNRDDFKLKGGLRAMGEAMRRGMVMVLSLWDDELTHMLWLDSRSPADAPEMKPGVRRGPCSVDKGKPGVARVDYPEAAVTYSNIRFGEIGSTFGTTERPVASVQEPAAAPLLRQAPMRSTADVLAEVPDVPFADGPPGVASPVCCSSAAHADKCSSCFRGSAITTGFCASKETCGACGGHWCEGGVSFIEEKFQLRRPGAAVLTAVPGRWHRLALAACVPLAAAVAAALALAALRGRRW